MENSLFVNDTPTVRTPEQRSSVGVRGLFGDGLPSKDNNETSVTQSISVRTPKQGGTTCVGVRGITGEDLSSKVIIIFGYYASGNNHLSMVVRTQNTR